MLTANIISPSLIMPPTQQLWDSATNDYQIETHHVHLWKIDLQKFNSIFGGQSSLSDGERERVQHLIGEDKQHQFSASRTALREILSRYINISPQKIRFQYSFHGKPSIDHPLLAEGLQFNLSHSDDMMLLAISNTQPIGIDLEKIETIANCKWIAKQYLSSEATSILSNVPEDHRKQIFLQLWTLKEAVAKAHSVGFSSTSEPNYSRLKHILGLENDLPSFTAMDGYWISSFQPQNEFIAALAVIAHKEPSLKFYNFFPDGGYG